MDARPLHHLRVFLLGGFRVYVADREVPPGAWRLRKAAAIVKLLALAPGLVLHRDQLVEALWPDLEPSGGHQQPAPGPVLR